ncbi:DUF2199 domain-containing protein [Longispora sp. NPDC051575]|uniref:DUF2199 domain-containing protein n=1 Tax=Longispora sp. NPDC051575 TaxID=3154943 RepID=UPI00342C7646
MIVGVSLWSRLTNRRTPTCTCCANGLDASDPRFNLSLPTPVAELSETEFDEQVIWVSDQVVITRTLGGFVRVLLPVPLTDGRTATIGIWASVSSEDFEEQLRIGRGEAPHSGASLEGRLANDLEPWGDSILAAPVRIASPGERRTLVVLPDSHPRVAEILTSRWRPAEVLPASMAWALDYDPAAHVRNV